MTDFENPPTAADDPKATKVSAFDLKPTSLTLTITRDGHDTYLAAINAWIAGGLR